MDIDYFQKVGKKETGVVQIAGRDKSVAWIPDGIMCCQITGPWGREIYPTAALMIVRGLSHAKHTVIYSQDITCVGHLAMADGTLTCMSDVFMCVELETWSYKLCV